MKLGPEDSLQRNCVAWFRLQYPTKLIWATPNGGHRNIVTAMKLKMTGVRAGVPDLFIAEPAGDYHGAFMELKVGKNKPTSEQKEMIEQLRKRGYWVNVCYHFEEFVEQVREYFKG